MKYLITLAITVLFVGCYSPIVFDEAYPKGVEPLKSLSPQYTGVYMCESDSTIITIDDQMILALEFNYFLESVEDMNQRPGCTLIDDEVYIDEIEDCIPIEYIGEDSIRGRFTTVDTLFDINLRHIAKPYRGSLVLSQKAAKDEYILSILSLDAYGNVFYRAINENSELEEVANITEMEQVGVDRNHEPIYKIKPNEKEFEQIFEHEEIFIVCEYLMRINLEEFPDYIF